MPGNEPILPHPLRRISPPQNQTNLAWFCRKTGMGFRRLVPPLLKIRQIRLGFVGKWGWGLSGCDSLPRIGRIRAYEARGEYGKGIEM